MLPKLISIKQPTKEEAKKNNNHDLNHWIVNIRSSCSACGVDLYVLPFGLAYDLIRSFFFKSPKISSFFLWFTRFNSHSAFIVVVVVFGKFRLFYMIAIRPIHFCQCFEKRQEMTPRNTRNFVNLADSIDSGIYRFLEIDFVPVYSKQIWCLINFPSLADKSIIFQRDFNEKKNLFFFLSLVCKHKIFRRFRIYTTKLISKCDQINHLDYGCLFYNWKMFKLKLPIIFSASFRVDLFIRCYSFVFIRLK